MKTRLGRLQRHFGLLVAALACEAAGAAAPSFLVVVADDMRADAIGAHGNRAIRTPSLDRLVAEGFSFREAHCMGGNSGAVCVASRAMLMSGRGLFDIENDLGGQETLPELLERRGYETFIAGKWHNGAASCARSFRTGGAVFLGGMTDQFRPKLSPLADHRLGEGGRRDVYSTDAIAGAAEGFLRGRDPGKPFFAWVSFTVPHDPRTPSAEFAARYDPESLPLPAAFLPQHPFDHGWLSVRDERLLDWPLTAASIRRELAAYYAMITHLDERLGGLLDALGPAAANTFVIFLSDHGLALGSHGLLGKQNLYEPSMRAPFIIRGPGVPKGGASSALVYLHDFHATVRSLAGVEPPRAGPAAAVGLFESRDLSPLWRDGQVSAVRDDLVLALTDTIRALRTPRWKLIRYPQVDVTQLFDLDSDPHESNNLASSDPDRVAALRATLASRQAAGGDRVEWTAATLRPAAADLTGRRANPDALRPPDR
jgi:arylsulfatase A-like enzyme